MTVGTAVRFISCLLHFDGGFNPISDQERHYCEALDHGGGQVDGVSSQNHVCSRWMGSPVCSRTAYMSVDNRLILGDNLIAKFY